MPQARCPRRRRCDRGPNKSAPSGNAVTVHPGEEGIRILLVSGKPIREPVAWYAPIVMNMQAEIEQAIAELRDGTFLGQP